LAGLHVALDVGHSLASGGALSARGRSEHEFNRDTALALAAALRRAGARVSVINETGTLTGLAERPQRAQRLGAHAFVSIHHDAVNDRYLETWEFEGKKLSYCDRFRGPSVFCSKKNPRAERSRTLALELGAALVEAGFTPTLHHAEAIPGENRPLLDRRTGVYEFTDLVVAKAASLPSVLLECGVIVHREEELEVQTEAYRHRLATALAVALDRARAKGAFGRFKAR
jgi:N-acetylmuramoyl-L-alanine amidase